MSIRAAQTQSPQLKTFGDGPDYTSNQQVYN